VLERMERIATAGRRMAARREAVEIPA
jgi:hypothetical protein